MKKDTVEKIDELNELFAFAGAISGALSAKAPMSNYDSPAIQSELNMLFNKVMDVVKNMKQLTTANKKKIYKKAVEVVIRKEGLNKNWSKLLKKYVKQYA